MIRMQKETSRIIGDIKKLKVQGARNVAIAAMNALAIEAKKSKASTPNSFYKQVAAAGELISISRPTEPMMRNSIDEAKRFLSFESERKSATVTQLKKSLSTHIDSMILQMGKDAAKLAEYGAKLIPDNAIIITHCHSSTVTGILKRAKKDGKTFTVISCETRPRYQGRITSAELAKAGIDVTLVVDGAANLFMKKADMCLVGADSITSKGDLINKVGTSMLAHLAKIHDVSFFSAAELSKFSQHTIFGEREKIEERDSKEVWDKPAKGVKIRNPAFDVTASSYISGYITELGVIPPQSLLGVATQKFGIKF
jgi:ribose 1,5-bisphosphate isomerase